MKEHNVSPVHLSPLITVQFKYGIYDLINFCTLWLNKIEIKKNVCNQLTQTKVFVIFQFTVQNYP